MHVSMEHVNYDGVVLKDIHCPNNRWFGLWPGHHKWYRDGTIDIKFIDVKSYGTDKNYVQTNIAYTCLRCGSRATRGAAGVYSIAVPARKH